MDNLIFYSWQTDAPSASNRTFIRSALDAAIGDLHLDAAAEDSPRVDSGMEGIAGTPEVATVMFEKINRSSIFVADMTLVGQIPKAGDTAKKVPNPNVLLEMGYAASAIGWGRVVCVMNEHFGLRAELPFDVRNRRFPINYTLNPGTMANSDKQFADLRKWLAIAIKAVDENELMRVQTTIAKLDVNGLTLMHAFGKGDWFSAPSPGNFRVEGPLDTLAFDSAVTRLLDLGLIISDVNMEKGLYAYHWSHLGKRLLKELGIR